MPSPRKILPLLAGAAVLAGATVPVGADGAPMPQITTKYWYKVEFKGVQKTTWSYNHVGSGSCDSNASGSGSQTIRFSGKPTKIRMFDGISPVFFVGEGATAGELKFRLRGSVNRKGSTQVAPLSPEEAEHCPDGVGGPPPTPDCGTKKLPNIVVQPKYEFNSDKIILEQSDGPADPFQYCPNLGDIFPYLWTAKDGGQKIGVKLPTSDLFKHGKNIVIARGTRTDTGEVTSKSTIRWELSFTKIKEEKLAG